jgi:CyaY protein
MFFQVYRLSLQLLYLTAFTTKIEGQLMMTESEYTQLADAIFTSVENTLDDSESDIDYSLNGPVLEIEFEDGSQIIMNRHTPNQEIWLAAKSGGYHFSFINGQWLSKRDGCELFGKLSDLIRLGNGHDVKFM